MPCHAIGAFYIYSKWPCSLSSTHNNKQRFFNILSLPRSTTLLWWTLCFQVFSKDILLCNNSMVWCFSCCAAALLPFRLLTRITSKRRPSLTSGTTLNTTTTTRSSILIQNLKDQPAWRMLALRPQRRRDRSVNHYSATGRILVVLVVNIKSPTRLTTQERHEFRAAARGRRQRSVPYGIT
jgi:hypothetical protein